MKSMCNVLYEYIVCHNWDGLAEDLKLNGGLLNEMGL